MTIVTLGIDLAKNVFALQGVRRRASPNWYVLKSAVAGCSNSACSGAHHWAREFEKLGHTVRLMAPKFVAPYRMAGKRGKNDANTQLQSVRESHGRT